MTLKTCPVCKTGDLYAHCKTSPACDLVVCIVCRAGGSLDGRWWPRAAGRFARIANTADRLRKDVAE